MPILLQIPNTQTWSVLTTYSRCQFIPLNALHCQHLAHRNLTSHYNGT